MNTAQATHVCHVDCRLDIDSQGRKAHMMYAAEPSSAAGRYQWEQNAAIKRQGRRAWRATGQGQSRECRVWDERRRVEYEAYGSLFNDGRRAARGWRDIEDLLRSMAWQ